MNSDYEQKVLIDTNTIQWQETQVKNVFKKILAIKILGASPFTLNA